MESANRAEKVYFPGLNGLRFFAALSVIITHVELLKGQVGLANNWEHPVIFNLGGFGVGFFFVLSGFLITYLLMVEKKNTGEISVKAFYLRRIFRIWPLYYLVVIIAFFIAPHIDFIRLSWLGQFLQDGFWLKLFLYLILLPNLAFAMYPAVPHAGQLWSIGVEEQFYLLWPWLVKKSKKILRSMLIFALILVGIKIAWLILWKINPGNDTIEVIKSFLAMTKMESMAIGGAGAYFAFNRNERFLSLVFHPLSQLLAFASLPVMMYFMPPQIQDGEHIIYSVSFLVIIMNVALNPKFVFKLDNRVFNFLGNISYGIYMYHMLVVVFIIRFVHNVMGVHNSFQANFLYYTLSILVTIGVAALSFYFYEKPFMRLKKRFTVVVSGEDAKGEGK
jgi:peptidoglycan/LPS O-acetylase OafA/YrhL